jgi:hypothetical protein
MLVLHTDAAAFFCRCLGARLQQTALEQQLLRQSALQERQQALEQLQGELAHLDIAPAAATGAMTAARHAAAASCAADTVPSGRMISGFAAAAAGPDNAVGLDSIVLDVTADADSMASGQASAGHGSVVVLHVQPTCEHSQQQQQRQRGTWGPALQDLTPAAGAHQLKSCPAWQGRQNLLPLQPCSAAPS